MRLNIQTIDTQSDLMRGFSDDFDLPDYGTRVTDNVVTLPQRDEAPLFGGLGGMADDVAAIDVATTTMDVDAPVMAHEDDVELPEVLAMPRGEELNTHQEFDPHAFAPFFGSCAIAS